MLRGLWRGTLNRRPSRVGSPVGPVTVYVVHVQEPGGESPPAFQFNDADAAFDKVEVLRVAGCACYVERQWFMT